MKRNTQRLRIRMAARIFAASLFVTVASSVCAQSFHAPERIDVDVSLADWSPVVSNDGLELFFTHWVSEGNWDIFTAQRGSTGEPWGPSESVGDLVNSSFLEDSLTLSEDGLTMIFGSERPDGLGDWDLWQTTRDEVGGEWTEPVNLESINTAGGESTPSLSTDGRTLYFGSGCCPGANREGGRGGDIWFTTREDDEESWSEPLPLDTVNSGSLDSYPSISRDGMTLYFASNRQGTYGGEDVFVSTRSSLEDEFGEPQNLGPVINSPNVDLSPFIGTDGILFYTRNAVRNQAPWYLWQADSRSEVLGDFDLDGVIGAADIDILSEAIHSGRNIVGSDLNADRIFDFEDVRVWVKEIRGTWFGDANLDGEFNSEDLVLLLQAGEFEDSAGRNSSWATGDWNGDAEFTRADILLALQDGGYQQGPLAAVRAVPEPSGIVLVLLAVIIAICWRSWRTR